MTGIAGKLGRFETIISAATVDHEFSDWMLGLEADIVEMDGFEKTADADSNYWKNGLAGLCGGDASVRGRWNTAKRPTIGLRPGITPTTVTFGLNLSTVCFVVPSIIRKIEATQNVKEAANFTATIFVNGAPTYPTA